MTIKEYMELPYGIVIRKLENNGGDYYLAEVVELEGCWSDGETLEEAYDNVHEAMEGYIEVLLEGGREIPVPKEFM